MSGAAIKSVTEKHRASAEQVADERRTAAANNNQAHPAAAARDNRAASAARTDPEFDAALKKAQRERSRADGNPQSVRGNEISHQINGRQHDGVAGQVAAEQREMTIGPRAALIQPHPPDDAAFKEIVDQATYNKTVQPGVDAVRNAYYAGGAKAAGETLLQQTENVSPEMAERIVAATLPTIDSIAADMKQSLTEGGPIEYRDVPGVYGNIATATDYAARGNDGAQVASQVAATMLRHLPSEKFQPHVQGSPAYPLPAYQEAVMQSMSGGTGATLAVEMAAQLKNAGRTNEADSLLSAKRIGVEALQGRIEDESGLSAK